MQIDVSPAMYEEMEAKRLERMFKAAQLFDQRVSNAVLSGLQGALVDVLDTYEFACLKLTAIHGAASESAAIRLTEMVFLRKQEMDQALERDIERIEGKSRVDG